MSRRYSKRAGHKAYKVYTNGILLALILIAASACFLSYYAIKISIMIVPRKELHIGHNTYRVGEKKYCGMAPVESVTH